MSFAEICFEVAWKSVAVAGIALLLLRLFRSRSAAQRSWMANAALIATLLLPAAVVLLPRWQATAAVPAAVAKLLERMFAPLASPFVPSADFGLPAEVTASVDADILLFAAYGIPAALLLLLILSALGRLSQLRARARVLAEKRWILALARAQHRMGVKGDTTLLVSDETPSPVSWGVARPVILLNEETVAADESAEAILSHELAHIARLDWAGLVLSRIITALFWFNPLVWLLAQRAHQLREEAADDAVLSAGMSRLDYAALLVRAARQERSGFLLAANGVAPSRSSLKLRVTRVLDEGQCRAPACADWVSACLACAIAIAVPLAALSSPEPVEMAATQTQAAAPSAVPAPSMTMSAPELPSVPPPRSSPSAEPRTAIRPRPPIAAASRTAAEIGPSLSPAPDEPVKMAAQDVDHPHLDDTAASEAAAAPAAGNGLIAFRIRAILGDNERVQLSVDYLDDGNGQQRRSSQTWNLAEHGLAPSALAAGTREQVKFRIVREAGTFECEGVAEGGRANGTCRFTADPEYLAALSQRLIEAPTSHQLYFLALYDVRIALADELSRQFYALPTVETLVAAGIHGATLPYLRALDEAAYRADTVEDLVAFRIHGVDADYISGLRGASASLTSVTADDIVKMKIHRVTPAWVDGLAMLGYADLDADDLVKTRIFDISPDYVRETLSRMSVRPTLDQLVAMRIGGLVSRDADPWRQALLVSEDRPGMVRRIIGFVVRR